MDVHCFDSQLKSAGFKIDSKKVWYSSLELLYIEPKYYFAILWLNKRGKTVLHFFSPFNFVSIYLSSPCLIEVRRLFTVATWTTVCSIPTVNVLVLFSHLTETRLVDFGSEFVQSSSAPWYYKLSNFWL